MDEQQQGPDLLVPGNVDLFKQPKVANPDGSTSTVDSIGVNLDGREFLLPTVTPDGRHLKTAAEAIEEYQRTRRHLGIYRTQAAADAAGQQLHEDYAAGKYDQPPQPAQRATSTVGTVSPSDPAYGLSSDPSAVNRLRDSVTRAATTPAATAQRVLSLQFKTGLPADVIERNLDAIEKQATRADFDPVAFRKNTPYLASWLEQHPLNGPAAQEDLLPMTTAERALQVVKHSARTAYASFYKGSDIGFFSGMELIGDLLVKVNPGSPIGYWFRDQGLKQQAEAEATAAFIRGPEPQQVGTLERGVYGAAESAGQSFPILLGTLLTGGAGAGAAAANAERMSLGMMATQTGLPAYSQARAAGKGVVESMAFGGAQGAVEAWTEALPLHTLLGNLQKRKGVLVSIVKQIVPEVTGEEIATALQDLDEWAVLHPDRPFSDYAKARPQAFVDTALATIIATGAQTGALHAVARVASGLTTGPSFEHLGDQVKQTSLASASPAAYEDFIRHVTADGGDTVHAPLESWDTYWQTRGVDPAAKAAEVTGDADAYRRAHVEGHDLPIPTARYLTQIAPTEHNGFFKDEIRASPASLNTREAKAALDELGKGGTPPPEADDLLLQRHQALVERLTEGGKFTPAQAEKQARLVEAVVGQLAERKGADPAEAAQQLLDRIGISRPEVEPGGAGERFGQPSLADENLARLTDTQPQRTEFEQLAEAATQQALFGKTGLPDKRLENLGPPPAQTERRGVVSNEPITGTIAERMAQMRRENPAIEREGRALAARDFAHRHPIATFLGYGPDGPLYNVSGGPHDKSTKSAKGLQELGITVPETPADTGERLNGAQLREIALKARGQQTPVAAAPAPKAKSFDEMLAAFGGSGHPESSDYVGRVLAAAGTGLPGLTVQREAEALGNTERVVYRDKEGNPVAVAKVVEDQAGKKLVYDLAADKSKGLLTGRAMQAIGQKLVDMGATEAHGTVSADAANFIAKMAERLAPRVPVPGPTRTYYQTAPGPAETFYSRIVRAVQDSKQNAAQGAQWKAAIRNAKGGINQDEFALTRVGDLEDSKRYTKDEVLTYLAANEVTVEDVTLGDEGSSEDYQNRLDEMTDEIYDEMIQEEETRLLDDYDFEVGDADVVEDSDAIAYNEDHADDPDFEEEPIYVAVIRNRRNGRILKREGTYYTEEEAQRAAETERDDMEEKEREDAYTWASDNAEVDRSDARQQAEERLRERGEGDETRTRYGEYSLPGGEKGTYREVFLTLPEDRVGGGPTSYVPEKLVIKRRVLSMNAGEVSLYYGREEEGLGVKLGTFVDPYTRGFAVQVLDAEGNPVRELVGEGGKHDTGVEIPAEWYDRGRNQTAPNEQLAAERAQRRAEELQQEPGVVPEGGRVEVRAEFRGASDQHWQELAETMERRRQQQLGRQQAIAPEGWVDGHDEYEGISNPIVRIRLNSRHTLDTNVPILFIEEIQHPHEDEFEKMPELFQKNWREIAFKWALRYAVDHDLQAVAWTTGKQQVERYPGMATQIEDLAWTKATTGKGDHLAIITVRPLSGEPIDLYVNMKSGKRGGKPRAEITGSNSYKGERAVGHSLVAAIGGKLAKRVLTEAEGSISGAQLDLGGEGLKTLYDVDFVNVANGIPAIKRNGGKVETLRIPKPGERTTHEYVGPQFPAEEIRTLAKTAEFDRRPEVAQQLYNVANAMQVGHSLQAAMSQLAGKLTMQYIGGNLKTTPPQGTVQPAVFINQNMRESIRGGQPRFQEGPQQPERRGFIQFGPGDRINIGMLPSADLSTFLHETGHLFLKLLDEAATELRAIDPAILTDSQKRLLDDHTTLLDWLGLKPGEDITTAAHEKMAEGFTDYLHEGKAPSIELQSIFSTFRAWLSQVYRALRRLNVDLTPEVRGVFDRMLASDDAIAQAEAARAYVPLFASAADMGVSQAEFDLYVKGTEKDRAAARGELDRRLMQEVEREKTAIWNAQRAATREQVKSEIQQQPVYRALAAMQYGTDANGDPIEGLKHDGPLRLSKEMLIKQYGEERVRALRKIRPYIYQLAEGGLSADYVAELTGHESGDAMLRQVVAAPPIRVAIENETNARMLQEHGSIQTDGSMPAIAQEATANLYHDEVLRLELQALEKLRKTVSPFVRLQKAISEGASAQEIERLSNEVAKLKAATKGGPATIRAALPSREVVKALAEQRINDLPIRRINAQTFWMAARRASQAATEKAARQDFDGAIVAKQQEILNLALYREAEHAQEDVEARVERAKRFDSPASRKAIGLAGGSYQDQIDGILDRYEFAKVSQKVLDRRASLAKWVAGIEATGQAVDLPDEVLDESKRVNYAQLTVGDLRAVTDGLDQIAHLARLKNKLLAAKDLREFTAQRDEVEDSIRANNAPRPATLEFRPGGEKWRTLGNYLASHTKMSQIVQALDGYVDGGPFWSAFIRPLNEAAAIEEQRKGNEGAAYVALIEKHYPDRKLWDLNEPIHVPALNASISKEFAIAVAQNWGNEQGRERILNDPVRKFDEAQVAAILDLLDQNDWEFVQAHWDYLDHFWPEIAAKQQRVTGVAPEKVDALPVHTKYGVFKGGYHPLAYDGRLSPRAQQFASAEAPKLQMSAAYIRTTTKRGHTKTRQDHVGLPVRLDMSVAFAHVDQVIHDLTHHETLIDVNRLLRDPKVAKAIYDVQGDEVYNQLKDGLEDVARGTLAAPGRPTVMDQGATWLRTHTQLAMMAFNVWTAIQQPLGVFNGMDRVGVKWVARGMKRWLRDAVSMESTTQWIADRSPMMASRVTTATQDLHDVRAALQSPGGWFDKLVRAVSSDHLTQRALTDAFLWHISVAQRVADVPTWLGQYEKSMAAGEPEDRAIALADQAVLDSQGGGQIKDLAKVQRGGPVARAFMTFASYGVTTFNAAQRNVDIARRQGFKDPAAILKMLGHMGLLYGIPALATITLKHAFGRGKPDDDLFAFMKEVGAELMSSAMSGLIYLREIAGAAQIATGLDPGGRGYSGPAALRPFQVAYDVATQIKQGDLDTAFWHSVNSAAGFLWSYPAAQVQKTVDGAVALYEGRTSNPAALLFGPPPKQ